MNFPAALRVLRTDGFKVAVPYFPLSDTNPQSRVGVDAAYERADQASILP